MYPWDQSNMLSVLTSLYNIHKADFWKTFETECCLRPCLLAGSVFINCFHWSIEKPQQEHVLACVHVHHRACTRYKQDPLVKTQLHGTTAYTVHRHQCSGLLRPPTRIKINIIILAWKSKHLWVSQKPKLPSSNTPTHTHKWGHSFT